MSADGREPRVELVLDVALQPPDVAVEVALDRAHLRVELGVQLVAELR